MSRMITLAIHTYDKALALRTMLENEGIEVVLHNVNLEVPEFSSGVRVRINEQDLPLALRIVENRELFTDTNSNTSTTIHSILVPVDLSENSFKACKIACHIARKSKSSITLLYSYLDPYITSKVQFTDSLTYDSGENGAREQLSANAQKLLDNFSERLRKAMKQGEVPVVKYNQIVVEGVPEDGIVDYAKDKAPRLIVMGTRGAEKKQNEMIGSVTAEVLDEGRFTVLTVPEPLDIEVSLKPSKILFLGNLDQDDVLAIDTLYRLYGDSEASVTIMHTPKKRRFSDKSAETAMKRLSEYCRVNFKQYHFATTPVQDSDSDSVLSQLQQEHFDLIAVPNRRRNAFSRLFNPGLAHKLLSQTDIPLLVIPV